jgi:lipopolysaccharide transport system ATP-binding protein
VTGRITVTNLGKAYRRYPHRWARLAEWLDPRGVPRHSQRWALQGIDFDVQPGEAVGIIGMNGAGKSTLLKMITGTASPTTGQVQIEGRVAALLELGMGFHPEFTGRQNARMAGQLLGYKPAEVDQLMPAIEAFAEIGDYMDEPVRVYSSGMQVRLAFSVATASRPDVLIVDEALSVGDDYFQHKSFDRIRDFRRLGTTLLIVSHDKQAIQSICDRALLLKEGHLAFQGTPEAVMDYYNALLAAHQPQKVSQTALAKGKVQTVSGTRHAVFRKTHLLSAQGQQLEVVQVGQAVCLEVQVEAAADLDTLVVGYMIKDRLGQPVFGTNTHHLGCAARDVKAGQLVSYRFDFAASLGEGSYSVAVAVHGADSHVESNYEWRDLALVFSVINADKPVFVGGAWLPSKPRRIE